MGKRPRNPARRRQDRVTCKEGAGPCNPARRGQDRGILQGGGRTVKILQEGGRTLEILQVRLNIDQKVPRTRPDPNRNRNGRKGIGQAQEI